jgi:2-polyprenyl-3-methyl-5-hydroxy-6-metoxy-1,4-benzoquinol methylase
MFLIRPIRERLRPTWRPLSIQLRFRLFGKKIDRNQWAEVVPDVARRRERMLSLSWDQIATEFPPYFARLRASLPHIRGRVLELGCGEGNMTRWIAARDQVSAVMAVDGFAQAIHKLRQQALPKVEARCGELTGLHFKPDDQFDTLVMCELLEHLYPDEERALREAVLPHMAQGAGYLISAPIGWLEDPHHVRAFSEARFKRHLSRHYGPVDGRDTGSGYSQVAWGRIK